MISCKQSCGSPWFVVAGERTSKIKNLLQLTREKSPVLGDAQVI